MPDKKEAELKASAKKEIADFFDKMKARAIDLVRKNNLFSSGFPLAVTVAVTVPDPDAVLLDMLTVCPAPDESGNVTPRGAAIFASRDMLFTLACLCKDTDQNLDLLAAINSHPMLQARPVKRTIVDLVEDVAVGSEAMGKKNVH